MPPKPASEKTEQPTTRRLQKAREKGQVVQSQELPAAISIIVLTTVLALTASSLMQWFMMQMKQGLSCSNGVFVDSDTFIDFFTSQISASMLIISPILGGLVIGSIIACVSVGGLTFSAQPLKFKPESINPIEGTKKLFNMKSLVKLCLSIVKLIFVSLIVWVYLESKLETIAALRWAWSYQILATTSKIILGLLIRVCIGLFIIAIADVAFQKWKYIQNLKMTKQEVKEEQKQTDGSPEIKSRIRRTQIEMAMKRMLQDVPQADIVLVNPTHVAVAVKYDARTMEAPVLLAKGADHMAEKIREVARAYGVPIIRRPSLARTLYSTVEIGSSIPQKLFAAVAEVLAMIYRLRHRR